MRKLLAGILIIAFFTGCGLLSKNKKGNGSSELEKWDKLLVLDYSGTYDVVGQDYEAKLTIKHADEHVYRMRWVSSDVDDIDDTLFAFGVENDGYLGFVDSDSGDEWGIVGVYKRQGDKITGLWGLIEGDLVLAQCSPGVGRMPLSYPNIEGRWKVNHLGVKNPYTFFMTIEENGNTWVISQESEDGFIRVGMGMSVDQILITCFGMMDSKIITVYTIDGDKLYGRWAYQWVENESNRLNFETGTEVANRQKKGS